MEQTLVGLTSILESCTGKVVIWENEYYGAVDIDGKNIVETQLHKRYRERIGGVVKVAQYRNYTLAVDMKLILEKRMTFDDSKTSGFRIRAQHRIQSFKDELFGQLESIGL